MIENIGPSIKGLFDDRGTPGPEMAAFDQLGPQVRLVINEGMCVNWSAKKTLEMMRMLRQDPKNTRVDREWAARLRAANEQVLVTLRLMVDISPHLPSGPS